jgi:hypothetical protein
MQMYDQQTQEVRNKALGDCHQKGLCQPEVYARASEEASFAKSCADASGKVCRFFSDYQNVDFYTVYGQKHITEASIRPFMTKCVATSCPSNEGLNPAYTCHPMEGWTDWGNGTKTKFSFPCDMDIWCEEPCQKNENGKCIELFDKIDHSVPIVVFVLDFSASMDTKVSRGGPSRLELLKSQVVTVLKSLSQEQTFTVIKFGSAVAPLSLTALKATKDNVNKAASWIQSSIALGSTNLQGALESAYKVSNANAIYLLTDGAPTIGCNEVSCLISGHGGAKVNTVLLDGEAKTRVLMKGIADGTGGTFREPLTEQTDLIV